MDEYVRRLESKESLETLLDIKEMLDEFLIRISQTRHYAIYGSLGSDSEVMSNLINRDAINDYGIDYQAIAFKNFCYGFINENVDSLIELLNFIQIHKKTRNWLRYAIFQPWFDEQQIIQIKDNQLQQKLQQIKSLLFSKRQKYIPPIE